MILKLGFLSLSLLLIASLNAQLMQAQLHGAYPSNDEGRRYSQPQRFDPHHHHRPSHIHHGHGPHHEYEHNHIQGSLMPNCNFGPYPREGVRPCVGYGGQQPGPGYGGQGFGYPPRPGYDGRLQPFQPRPGQPHWPEDEHEQRRPWIQPRPQPGGQDTLQFSQQRPGYGRNPLQPRPDVAPSDENEFQQSGSPIQPRPGQPHWPNQLEDDHEQRRPSIQPRPQPGGQDTLQFSQQQPGNGGNPLQPRPDVAPSDENEFQQSGSSIQPRPQQGQDQGKRGNTGSNTPGGFQDFNGESGNPIQPRPTNEATFNSQTAGDTAIQPRPQQGQDQGQFELNNQQRGNTGSNSPSGFQEPYTAEIGNPIQPRPTNEPTFNFQTAGDTAGLNPIQPVPGQSANPGQKQGTDAGFSQSTSTIQPHPNIDDQIASIFNTNNFLASALNANSEPHGSRDPKSETEDVKPEVIAQRNLFNTMQQCPEGTTLRSGHCRHRA